MPEVHTHKPSHTSFLLLPSSQALPKALRHYCWPVTLFPGQHILRSQKDILLLQCFSKVTLVKPNCRYYNEYRAVWSPEQERQLCPKKTQLPVPKGCWHSKPSSACLNKLFSLSPEVQEIYTPESDCMTARQSM